MRNQIAATFGSILWETKLQEHLAGFFEKQNYRNIWLDFMRNKITGKFGWVLWETNLQEHLTWLYEKQNYKIVWLDFSVRHLWLPNFHHLNFSCESSQSSVKTVCLRSVFSVRTFFKLRDYIRVGFQRPKIYLKASVVS